MKNAIIIGASSGIGRELAKMLATDGYSIAITARRVQLLNELHDELPGDVLVRKMDVSDPDSSKALLSEIIGKMGGADLIVFAAGTGEINEQLNWQLEHTCIMTNVSGFAAIANVAIRQFIKQKSGHFVAISSISAIRGGSASPAYHASKSFLSNYLEGLRQKVTKMQLPITVTDIKPGFVDTAMAKGEGQFWVAPVNKAASQIYQAIRKKKSHCYVTRRWRLIAWLLKVLPDSLYIRL